MWCNCQKGTYFSAWSRVIHISRFVLNLAWVCQQFLNPCREWRVEPFLYRSAVSAGLSLFRCLYIIRVSSVNIVTRIRTVRQGAGWQFPGEAVLSSSAANLDGCAAQRMPYLCTYICGSFLGNKRSGREVSRLFLSSTEVKNAWIHTSTFPRSF